MAQEPKNKQPDAPPQRRNWVDAVAPSVSPLVTQAFTRAGFSDMTLILRWSEIAGPQVARMARPVKFTGGADGGTLTLKCEPGAALFLQHESRSLMGRINGYLGRQAVSRIKFVQGPLLAPPEPQLRRAAQRVLSLDDPVHRYSGPESMKSALLNLAARRKE